MSSLFTFFNFFSLKKSCFIKLALLVNFLFNDLKNEKNIYFGDI